MSMLKTLEIKFSINKFLSQEKLNYVLLSYIFEHIEENELNRKSIHQYFLPTDEPNTFIWRISALNDFAVEQMLYPLYEKCSGELHFTRIKSYDLTLKILEKNYIHSATHRQLVAKYFRQKYPPDIIRFELITPLVLKLASDDNARIYLLDSKTIIKDLLTKWNYFAQDDYIEATPEILADLTRELKLSDYDLRIQPFSPPDEQISLQGKYELTTNANIMTKKLLCILAEYANFSGIGINNYFGYGATKVRLYHDRMKRINKQFAQRKQIN